eukprot:scaffold8455_cov104-Isochrysis_galbana.AAC.9
MLAVRPLQRISIEDALQVRRSPARNLYPGPLAVLRTRRGSRFGSGPGVYLYLRVIGARCAALPAIVPSHQAPPPHPAPAPPRREPH